MRRGDDNAVRKALALPEHKRKGRPASTWWTTVAKDIKNANLIDVSSQDRESWRRKTRYSCIVEPLLESVCGCLETATVGPLRRVAARSLTTLLLSGYLRLRTPLYYT
ncbi:jg26675, partial [Pararge aegeria aegeria]